jgi:uncharacterized protein (TIGR00299 family) protein
MHIHLDPVGGLAGDMFVAAMLDAFPALESLVQTAVRAAGLPGRFRCDVVRHGDHALHGRRFLVVEAEGLGAAHGEPVPGGGLHHHHDHHHGHRPFAEIRDGLLASGLEPEARDHALAIFTHVAAAEARVHGATVEAVSFHELGEWDSIADIVAAAAILAALAPATWSVGPLPLGSGFVKSAHGLLPVPAPATVELLKGLAVRDDGIAGERVTPTGAAIARHLTSLAGAAPTNRRILGVGLGFGTRVLPGISNCVRALVFESEDRLADATSTVAADPGVVSLEFEVDDQTPEDLAIGLDHIREHPGVLDVLQTPGFGKKGRIVIAIRVLARADSETAVARLCFHETTTLGLRMADVRRHTLARSAAVVEAEGRSLALKHAHRGDGAASLKVEAESLRAVSGHEERERLRRLARESSLQ